MKHLTFIVENNIAAISFSRPDALNALNKAVFVELNQLLDKIEQSKSIRVVLLTGSGKAFIAGADIAEMKGMSQNEALQFSKQGQDTLLRIEQMPIPFIGVINGFALGGGLEMALACDFLLASDKAKFSAPEVNLGLIPGFAGTQRLARAIGINQARYYLYTAQMFDAHEAQRMGLVQHVFEADELMDKALEIAALICSKAHSACQAISKVVNKGLLHGFEEGSALEHDLFAELFNAEAPEGMAAFLEKRQPKW